MNLSLIILVLAVIAVLCIFGFRFYEFHSGRLLIAREVRTGIEKKVIGFYARITQKVVAHWHALGVFLKGLPTVTAHIMHFYWRKFSKKVDQFFLKIRNKK